jgi:hypothetical protein
MILLQEFQTTFKPLLTAPSYRPGQFQRYPAFEFIAKELLSKDKPLKIIETGTLRKDDDWLGYGHSALIWEWLLSKKPGKCYSVDIDHTAIKFARTKCKYIDFIHCDSIGFLRGADATDLDLLFLDSYDWGPEKHLSSCLHHMTELGTIWDRLPSGCLVVVDDAHSATEGKHVLVHNFFEKMLGLQPLISCHMEVWRKP